MKTHVITHSVHHPPFHETSLVQFVRLTRKLAPVINGIDLSKVDVGDVVVVPEAVAGMLILEGWAEPVRNDKEPPGRP